jgi:PAS domain S-box-containing protein
MTFSRPSRTRILDRALICALLISACLGTVPASAADSPDRPRRILFIPSYNFDYKGIQWFLQGVMAEFTAPKPFKTTLSLENLQLAAHPSDRKYLDTMAASLKIKYSIEQPDLIIVQYKQALQFLESYGKGIFGEVPVVFAGLSVEGYAQNRLPPHYTGIVASFSATKNIELIRANHPSVRRIYLVSGTSPVEKSLVDEAIREARPYHGSIDFVTLNDLTFPALLERLAHLEDGSAVMYQALQLDAAGKVFVPAHAAVEIARAARVPVYGMLDTYMGSGVVGGFLINHDLLGRRAARTALQWLQTGSAPETVLKREAIGSYRFDGRQLQRWGIDEKGLPPASTIEFKTFSLWDSYRTELLGGAGLLLVQTLLIVGLLWNRRVRIRAERKMRESEERFRVIFERSTVGMSLTGPQGHYVRINQAFADMLGYRIEEIQRTDFMQITHPEDVEEGRKYVQSLLADEQPVYRREKRYLHKSGAVVWADVSTTLLRDGRGKPLYLITSIVDITERKQAEAEREKLQEQMLQLQKMESVGRLAGGVAHDFNNLLGVIVGHTEMALEQVDQGSPLHGHLQEIRKTSRRSARLTSQLLAFARRQIVSPRVLDLNETVEGMLLMLRRLIGEDIDLVWLPGTGLWPIRMDPSQIDQVLVNLCINARDAIAGVGKVTIETRNATFDAEYCAGHMDALPGDYALLTVSDSGCGMDHETLTHIFEPFFTTKAMGKGTGLGLATVYGIIRQNGGFVNVYSEPGQGTTFRICLPRHRGTADEVRRASEEEPEARGRETVLVVEDQPELLNITKRMLQRQGYTVLAASGPAEAVRLAGEHGGELHLLMTDVVMPGMNGRDLAAKLLSRHPDLRVLFMSGYTANVIAHQGVLEEGVHFLQKPFSRKELAAKVREALDRG